MNVPLTPEQDKLRHLCLEDLRREIHIGLDEARRGELAPLDVTGMKARFRQRHGATATNNTAERSAE